MTPKYQRLRDGMIRTIYIPWTQRVGVGDVRPPDQPSSYNYVLRAATGDPMRLAPDLDRLIREVDPALHVRTTMAYDTVIGRSIAHRANHGHARRFLRSTRAGRRRARRVSVFWRFRSRGGRTSWACELRWALAGGR